MRRHATKTLWLQYCQTTCQGSRYVNVFLAAIFGLVLPFVCWGAEATPGHPHLRVHFVFMAPERFATQIQAANSSAQSVLRLAYNAFADGLHSLCTAPTQSTAPAPLAGQSTPQTLVISLLLLMILGALFALFGDHDSGFFERLSAPGFFSLPLEVATPPPRFAPLS